MNKYVVAALALLFAASCGQASKRETAKDSATTADGGIPTRVTVKDGGVLIDYTDTKKGDTVLLFVHGWLINKNYFSNQITYFQDRYRVVAIDLPGYGQSGKNRNSWTVPDFARDVDSVMVELNLNKVILVGHSMSGDVVLEAALHDTQRVIGIVGIDNFKTVGVPEDPKEAKDFQEAVKAMKKKFTPVAREYFGQALFSKDTDSSVKKRILDDIGHSDSAAAIATIEAQNFDETAALKSWHKPLYLVNSDYSPTDTSDMYRTHMPFYLQNISKSGHFPMVEQPQQFNKALQQIIHLIGNGQPPVK